MEVGQLEVPPVVALLALVFTVQDLVNSGVLGITDLDSEFLKTGSGAGSNGKVNLAVDAQSGEMVGHFRHSSQHATVVVESVALTGLPFQLVEGGSNGKAD